MKKLIVAILALVYITTSTGAVIRVHYCMGELADWSIGVDNSKTCGKCGMQVSEEKDNGCCKDKHTFVKNNSDQKFAQTGLLIIPILTVALPVSFIKFHADDFLSIREENSVTHPPLRSRGVAVYIRNCVFLI